MTTMREQVARAIHANDSYYKLPLDLQSDRDTGIIYRQADAAITACLTALTVEADARGLYVYEVNVTAVSKPVGKASDFIRSFVPSQPEVTDE